MCNRIAYDIVMALFRQSREIHAGFHALKGTPMRNLISRWTVVLGCSVVAVFLLGCGSSGSGPTGSQPAGGAAAPHEHADHEHADHKDRDHQHADHEHADAVSGKPPADFAAGVAGLQQQYEAIRDAFRAGDKGKADGPLHQVGHTLEALPELAAKAKLGEQDVAAAKSAATVMFEAYGKLDEAIHGGKEPDYGAAADTLDKAMAELSELAKRMAAPK
jgi:hypothetical protein